MRERRIDAVLFDAAGTLIHPREPVGESYARLAAEAGVVVPASRLEEAFGRVIAAAPPNVHPGEPLWRSAVLERAWWRERVRETFRAADGTARFEDFDAFFGRVFDSFADAAAWRVAEGGRPCLESLRERGIRLAVISNFDQRLRGILTGLDLHRLFLAVTLPADAGAAKPERAIFDASLKRLGLPGFRVLHVGDRAEEDVKAAKAAGMHALDVGRLGSLAELPAWVDRLEEELR